MTEQELREVWQKRARECRTLSDLAAFHKELADHTHDYGSCCVAIGAFAIAAAWVAERTESIGRGGITGFQAGAVQWEMIGGWDASGAKNNPQKLMDYGNLLWPQYAEYFTTITPETWEWAQQEAKKRLAEGNGNAVGPVRKHWQSIAAGTLPFSLTVAP